MGGETGMGEEPGTGEETAMPGTESAPAAGGDDAGLVARAVAGDEDALTEVVRRLQDPVYRLALRMMWRPADAEDAMQEILIRVLTRLATFRAEASLVTWAYRIAVNHLIGLRRRTLPEQRELDASTHRADLLAGSAAPSPYDGPDAHLLAEEVRLACTQALLQCLDRPGRAAYVLGEVLCLPGAEAAWVLGLSPAGYRKRLERARRRVREAVGGVCGLLDPAAPCRCDRRIGYAVERGRVTPGAPVYVGHPAAARAAASDIGALRDVGALLRTHPAYTAPRARTEAVLELVRSGRYAGLLPDGPPGG